MQKSTGANNRYAGDSGDISAIYKHEILTQFHRRVPNEIKKEVDAFSVAFNGTLRNESRICAMRQIGEMREKKIVDRRDL